MKKYPFETYGLTFAACWFTIIDGCPVPKLFRQRHEVLSRGLEFIRLHEVAEQYGLREDLLFEMWIKMQPMNLRLHDSCHHALSA